MPERPDQPKIPDAYYAPKGLIQLLIFLAVLFAVAVAVNTLIH